MTTRSMGVLISVFGSPNIGKIVFKIRPSFSYASNKLKCSLLSYFPWFTCGRKYHPNRGTGLIFLLSSGVQRHLREKVNSTYFLQYYSSVCKDTQPGKPRTLVHERGPKSLWPVLSPGHPATHSVTTTKFVFIATAKKFWVAPKPAQTLTMTLPLEISAGNGSWFFMCQSWGRKPKTHIWLFWAWSNGQMMGHSIRFFLVLLPVHREQLVSRPVILGFPLAEWRCPRTFLGFCAEGSPQCLSAEAPRQVWTASCQLPSTGFPGFRKPRKTIASGSRSCIAKQYSRTIYPPCSGSLYQ